MYAAPVALSTCISQLTRAIYVIVITQPRGIFLIYMPKPEGRRPEGAGIYIRQITSSHVISDICHVTLHVQWNAADAISAIYFIEKHMRFECGCEIRHFCYVRYD